MKHLLTTLAAAAMLLTTGLAKADGELFIYNWTEYTPPELITRFSNGRGAKVSTSRGNQKRQAIEKRRPQSRSARNRYRLSHWHGLEQRPTQDASMRLPVSSNYSDDRGAIRERVENGAAEI